MTRNWFVKVGKTFSYRNGRQLDDAKSLGELGFEVNQTAVFSVVYLDYISNFSNYMLLCSDRRLLGRGSSLKRFLLRQFS